MRPTGSNRNGPDPGGPRIAVASILQETNTWSPVPCTLDDFRCHGLAAGSRVLEYVETNTEIGGAIRALREAGCEIQPVLRAWANSSGRLTRATLEELCRLLVQELRKEPVDGLVLNLHGAMAADGTDDADLAVLSAARSVLGPDIPIGVTLDLHANVTGGLVASSSFVTGYRTYPHTDLAETGARAARLLVRLVRGETRLLTALSKRPMLLPAEAMSTSAGPFAQLRKEADDLTVNGVVDISLFPVQPWLDVEELGFGVTVTTDGDAELASSLAEVLAARAWERRHEFRVRLLPPREAVEIARWSRVRPFLLSESADAPTAGAAGDSPAMVRVLLEHGRDLRSYVTVTDPPAVGACFDAGQDGPVDTVVGCRFDRRYDVPVGLSGTVEHLGDAPVLLSGPSYTGMEVSMGRFAVVRSGDLSVLITERPAFTLDPATFRHAGLDPAEADVVVVRSALGFRAAFPERSVAESIILDLPGASTPRLDHLKFERAPRPMYPLDAELHGVPAGAPEVTGADTPRRHD